MKFLQLIFILSSIYAFGYDSMQIHINKKWKANEPDSLSSNRVMHLKLNSGDDDLFIVKSPNKFSTFINNQLISINKTRISYSLDSLKALYSFPIVVSLYSKKELRDIDSKFVKFKGEGLEENSIRYVKGSSILIAAFTLFWFLVFLFYNQRSITLEYFKLPNIFTIRNQDDNIRTLRVTSFSNLFIYIFCSILIALNLVAIEFPLVAPTRFTVVNILIIAAVILILLFLKILINSIAASFFDLAESAPNQFFNFVKLLMVCSTFSSICLILGFTFDVDKILQINTISIFTLMILIAYIGITFLRLNNKGGSTVFHLFSYLCISEIFPVLLLLKTYYF